MDNTNETAEPSGASGGSLAWIPVTHGVPGEYEHVIGWRRGWAKSAEVWLCTSGHWLCGDCEPAGNITHWMPLPAPPASAK